MIETRRFGPQIKNFHDKYPDTIEVHSDLFKTGNTMNEMVNWTKENFKEPARMDIEKSEYNSVYIVWYCVSELDATAAKLMWS